MSATVPEKAIADLVTSFMAAFEIPGMAIAVARGNQPDAVYTFGERALGRGERIDRHTQFAIASNSKAFLAAALAILVDRGALGWEDPVVKHLPDFRMCDPQVSRLMTVRDLLVHRSGLPLGAGDLMLIRKSAFTAKDVLSALQYFKPAVPFRAGYAYDNTLYIIAGMVLQQVSGLSWDEFVSREIFAPLGMNEAVTNPSFVSTDNHAARHGRLGPPVIGMGPVQVLTPEESDLNGPAGGIHASAQEILAWLNVQLARGLMADGRRLWSEAQAAEMWMPQTIIASGPGPDQMVPHRSVMEAYALGWGVADYRARRMLTHGGQLAGQVTRTALLPEERIGLSLLSNSAESEAISALRYALLDLLLEAPAFDWLGYAMGQTEQLKVMVANHVTSPGRPGTSVRPLTTYTGRYRDPWCGDIVIDLKGDELVMSFDRIPAFTSRLEACGENAFRTRFGRGIAEDARLEFEISEEAVTALKMKALSPLADFSFDYHHLDFRPVAAS